MVYGVGAYGEKSAQRVLEIFYQEIDKNMAFWRRPDINGIDK
ncbi:L-lactate dehydrogenase [Francisella sp. MA067296]|nr:MULTISPECIES: alpha-hydroxy-acid oxidizing protein [Francisella]APC90939.1 L-lactate dehydrogenase [Francisella sp. MA067296]